MYSEYKYIQQMNSGICLILHRVLYSTLDFQVQISVESKLDTGNHLTGLKHFQYCEAGVPEISQRRCQCQLTTHAKLHPKI